MKKEDKIINASSNEFPMKTFYGNVSPKLIPEEKPCIRLFPDLRNGFNNESPDFFRMDSMKENMTGYKNPYLNVVKTLDRSLFYKNNQSCIDHINMINKIKSRKDLSQNPKIIKQLCFSTDIDKLENKLHKESKITPYLYKTLSSDFKNPEYLKKIKTLNGEYINNHHYFTKNSFNLKKINDSQLINSKDEGENTNELYSNNPRAEKDLKPSFGQSYSSKNILNGNIKIIDSMSLENTKNNNPSNNLNNDKKTIFNYNINVNDMERAIEMNHNFNKNAKNIGIINKNQSKFFK